MSLDINAPKTSIVRLGDSFTNTKATAAWTALQYNQYRSSPNELGSEARITRQEGSGLLKLELKRADGNYLYNGVEAEDDYTIVLIQDEGTDTLSIEKTNFSWAFNLYETPSQKDGRVLTEQYEQLPANSPSELDDMADAEQEDEEPDADNPYHWKHYLVPETPNVVATAAPSVAISSPSHVQATSTISRHGTPVMRPVKKAVNPMLPNQRRTRQAQTAPSEPQHRRGQGDKASRNEPSVPEVRVTHGTARPGDSASSSRKAAVEDIIMDDSDTPGVDGDDAMVEDNDSLILDAAPDRHNSGSSRRNLQPQASQGPVSLRSAASSPGSRTNSPAPHHTCRQDTHQDLILDDVSDEDRDVEHLKIPSPARDKKRHAPTPVVPNVVTGSSAASTSAARRASVQTPSGARRKSAHHIAHAGTAAEVDEDDDLEAGLMEAMMADEEDGAPPDNVVTVDDEEEESEEE